MGGVPGFNPVSAQVAMMTVVKQDFLEAVSDSALKPSNKKGDPACIWHLYKQLLYKWIAVF